MNSTFESDDNNQSRLVRAGSSHGEHKACPIYFPACDLTPPRRARPGRLIGAGDRLPAIPPFSSSAPGDLQQLIEINTTPLRRRYHHRAPNGCGEAEKRPAFPAADVQVLGPAPKRGISSRASVVTATGRAAPSSLAHLDVVEAKREDWSPIRSCSRRGRLTSRDGARVMTRVWRRSSSAASSS